MATYLPGQYRRYITKSRSGHYHLTLIDKVTGLRQSGRYGWSNPAQARREEEEWCADQLAKHRFPVAVVYEPTTRIMQRFATIVEAEAYIASLMALDEFGVYAGLYGIDAPERTINP